MNKQLLSLDGEWTIVGYEHQGNGRIELTGAVPGHIHIDLLRAGIISDPFWMDNAEDCQWVENWEWVYSREFTVDESFDRDWAVMEFSGLDTYATISLNGMEIGKTANMFIPHRFEVGDKIKAGINKIEVRFATVGEMTSGKPLDKYSSCFSQDRVFTRKMQCTFAWDWVHRFVSAGIWQPVKLYSYCSAHLKDPFVYTQALDNSSAALKLEFAIERRTNEPLVAHVEIKDPEEKIIWAENVRVFHNVIRLNADITGARLWWPNGMGEQPLYRYEITLLDADSNIIDFSSTSFGIRTVRVEQIKDKPGSDEWEKSAAIRNKYSEGDRNGDTPGSGFTLIVNGERVFCKGGNWVPCDPFPGGIDAERYQKIIKLAAEGNINLLRCWGGGIYEPEAFWEACDRYGVMISQDFLMACAHYPEDDPDFMDQLREEFLAAIKMLRNHPSLAWWAGNNETAMHSDYDDPTGWGTKAADEISGPMCRELDPSRPFFSTSPFGGRPNSCYTVGDSHWSSWYPDFAESEGVNHKDLIDERVARFTSEYATAGAPPMRSLLKFMTYEEIADSSGRIWEYHTKNNPYSDSPLTHFLMLRATADKLFGEPKNVEEMVQKMEYAQFEWVRLAVEAARRNKWYCSGIQFWMYNDCWPASGWSIIDYYGYPKAAWYAMKRSSQGIIASIEDSGDAYRIWVCNDLLQSVTGNLNIRIQPWTGFASLTRSVEFNVPANMSQMIVELKKEESAGYIDNEFIMVCDLVSNVGSDRAFYYNGTPHEMAPIPAQLSVKRTSDADSGTITVSTDNYARVVTLDADLVFSDNYFDLLPGEEKTITWSEAQPATPVDIKVSCWNMRKD